IGSGLVKHATSRLRRERVVFRLNCDANPRPHRGTSYSPRLALVRADELRRRQNVSLDRPLQLGLARAGAKLELRVECVQAEDVAVPSVAWRRAGPAVAGHAEVVSPLARHRLALTKPVCARIESPGDPVREDAARSV